VSQHPTGTKQMARFDAGGTTTAPTVVNLIDATTSDTVAHLDHWNGADSAAGLDITFANAFKSARPDDTIIFMPGAQGSTGFASGQWPSVRDAADGGGAGTHYADAVTRINSLMASDPSYIFGGFLWHQGENDSTLEVNANNYQRFLDAMIDAFRKDVTVATYSTPFILGELASDLPRTYASTVQAAINGTPSRVGHTAVVSNDTLSSEADNTHFTPASYGLMGTLYYSALTSAAANASTAPAQVTGLMLTPTSEQIIVAWDAPANGKSAITSYIVERQTGGGAWSTIATITTLGPIGGVVKTTTNTGLTNGTTYGYRVTANNLVGAGPVSAVSTATAAVFNPVNLFTGSDTGMVLDMSNTATVFTDLAGTVLASHGDRIRRLNDVRGNGSYIISDTDAFRPTYKIASGVYSMDTAPDPTDDVGCSLGARNTSTNNVTAMNPYGATGLTCVVGAYLPAQVGASTLFGFSGNRSAGLSQNNGRADASDTANTTDTVVPKSAVTFPGYYVFAGRTREWNDGAAQGEIEAFIEGYSNGATALTNPGTLPTGRTQIGFGAKDHRGTESSSAQVQRGVYISRSLTAVEMQQVAMWIVAAQDGRTLDFSA
jgi:hypothetical protein